MLKTVAAFILRVLIFLPAEMLLLVISVAEFLDWIGAAHVPPFLDTEVLAPALGFSGGLTPFASWHNAGLWVAMFFLANLLTRPVIKRSFQKQKATEDHAERVKLRQELGKRLSALADVSKLLVVAVTLFILIAGPVVVPPAVRWVTLVALGTTLIVDGHTWSRKRHQYGLPNYFTMGEPRLIELLGRVTGNRHLADVHRKVVAREEKELDAEEHWG